MRHAKINLAERIRPHQKCGLTLCLLLWAAGPAWGEPGGPRGQDGGSLGTEKKEALPKHRNPQGHLQFGATLGIGGALGGQRAFVGGVGVGYAVLTGVLPGVRGLLIAGNDIGGEVAATLTLTPPFESYLTPFVFGEVGGRFEPTGKGFLYGGGGGLYVGNARSAFSLQLGWVFRRIEFPATDTLPSAKVDASGPLVALSVRL
jgi:hypothetical protein